MRKRERWRRTGEGVQTGSKGRSINHNSCPPAVSHYNGYAGGKTRSSYKLILPTCVTGTSHTSGAMPTTANSRYCRDEAESPVRGVNPSSEPMKAVDIFQTVKLDLFSAGEINLKISRFFWMKCVRVSGSRYVC